MKKIKAKRGIEAVLCVCGGIAAYKAAILARDLKASGISVTCILTENAARFVAPLTFSSLTGNKAYTDMFSNDQWEIKHISLAEKADLIAIAPATADMISKLACGRSDDLVSATVLSCVKPVLICPAMNVNMWKHPATAENVKRLKKFGYHFAGPEKGPLACGDSGEGRMAEPENIQKEIFRLLKA